MLLRFGDFAVFTCDPKNICNVPIREHLESQLKDMQAQLESFGPLPNGHSPKSEENAVTRSTQSDILRFD